MIFWLAMRPVRLDRYHYDKMFVSFYLQYFEYYQQFNLDLHSRQRA